MNQKYLTGTEFLKVKNHTSANTENTIYVDRPPINTIQEAVKSYIRGVMI